jgi:hypothetical protein
MQHSIKCDDDKSKVYWAGSLRAQTSKFLGSIKRSSQVPGQPEVAYEFPAQSPAKMEEIIYSVIW